MKEIHCCPAAPSCLIASTDVDFFMGSAVPGGDEADEVCCCCCLAAEADCMWWTPCACALAVSLMEDSVLDSQVLLGGEKQILLLKNLYFWNCC